MLFFSCRCLAGCFQGTFDCDNFFLLCCRHRRTQHNSSRVFPLLLCPRKSLRFFHHSAVLFITCESGREKTTIICGFNSTTLINKFRLNFSFLFLLLTCFFFCLPSSHMYRVALPIEAQRVHQHFRSFFSAY